MYKTFFHFFYTKPSPRQTSKPHYVYSEYIRISILFTNLFSLPLQKIVIHHFTNHFNTNFMYLFILCFGLYLFVCDLFPDRPAILPINYNKRIHSLRKIKFRIIKTYTVEFNLPLVVFLKRLKDLWHCNKLYFILLFALNVYA